MQKRHSGYPQSFLDRPGNGSFDGITSVVKISTNPKSVENVWPNKIRYCIEIPTKAVMIGSVIPITIKIESLLKGLTIGKILISLREYYTFDIPNESTFTDYRIVKSARLEDPDPEEDLDMWKIVENLKLPGTLSRCSQDCETGWIKVRHKYVAIIL